MTWTEHTVVREGVHLSCRDRSGPGVPIVLLHGLAGHAGEWDALAAHLGGHHRLVAVDQRGHGASERRPGDVSRGAYVADVVAVVEQLGLHRPVLVGQSLGGHTAMLTAAAHPDLAGGLVLVEAGPGRADPGLPAAIGEALGAWPLPFPSRAAAVGFFGGGTVGEGWAGGLEERDGGWRPRFDTDVMVEALAEIARRSFWDEWTGLSCPTLAVFGQAGIIPAEETAAMLERRPETVAASVPGAGHDVHLEHPEALGRLLREYVTGLGRHR
ncbi:alpha/beta fold hydrolase [Kitasatospora sp. NPDC051170]|uniref:alpha/beta fold hydrolase n=1 Tax=Kitasatospora sp. NPDC051170 TaxID=3364056 RepID=UPI0037B21FF2